MSGLEMLQIEKLPGRQRAIYRWSAGFIFGLIGTVLGGLISGPTGALYGGVIFGLMGVFIEKIEPTQAFIWSWMKTRSVLPYWTLLGLLAGLFCCLIYELIIGLAISQNFGLFFGYAYWFLIGLPEGLHVGLLCGLRAVIQYSILSFWFWRSLRTDVE
jgi:hypothetical protein